MKKKHSMFKRLLAGSLSAILSAGLLATPVFAADDLVNTPYEYPIVPGTPEWFEMKSFPEKIEACKIPEDKAKAMSTEALIETILNHPLWTIYFVYGMEDVYDIYSDGIITALQELEQRQDADKLLLERYQVDQVAPMSVNNATDKNGSKSEFLEILLAQPEFNDGLDQKELTVLDKEVAEKAEIRKNNSKDYVEVSPFYSVLEEKQDHSIITRATPYVYTPNGTPVAVEQRIDIDIPDDITTFEQHFNKTFPNCRKISGASSIYNCHSYAWHMSSWNNPYWMKNPENYWKDHSYNPYNPGSNFQAYSRAVFRTNNSSNPESWHSVLIRKAYTGSTKYVVAESKWARYGLYEHYLLDHPWTVNSSWVYNGSKYSITYYR